MHFKTYIPELQSITQNMYRIYSQVSQKFKTNFSPESEGVDLYAGQVGQQFLPQLPRHTVNVKYN